MNLLSLPDELNFVTFASGITYVNHAMKKIILLVLFLVLSLGQIFAQNTVQGVVFYDRSDFGAELCNANNELRFAFCPVVLTASDGTEHFALTNQQGSFSFDVASGQYQLSAHPFSNNNFIESTCSTNQIIIASPPGNTVVHNIAMVALDECPQLSMDMAMKESLAGTQGKLYLSYRNVGSMASVDPSLFLNLDDNLSIANASTTYISTQNSPFIEFPVGVVPTQLLPALSTLATTEVNVNIATGMGQGAILSNYLDGVTEGQCGVGGVWDSSEIVVTGQCLGTDSITFTIKNVGSGNMSQSNDYIIVQDDLLVYRYGTFQLNSGQQIDVTVYGGAINEKLTAEQAAGHPYLGNQSVLVQSCVTTNATLSVPQTGEPPLLSLVEPNSVFSSADAIFQRTDNIVHSANLEVYPNGLCDERYILQNQRLEFTLRARNLTSQSGLGFQMRFSYVNGLDLSTFISGASSERYRVSYDENDIVWTFPLSSLSAHGASDLSDQAVVKFSIMMSDDLSTGDILQTFSTAIIAGQEFISEIQYQTVTDSLTTCSNEFIWNGSLSDDWNTGSNWNTGAAPDDCSGMVIIDSDNYTNPPVISGNVQIGHLTLTGSVQVNQYAELKICGNVTFGPFTDFLGEGTLILNGTSAQTIDGKVSIHNLRIDNPAGVSLVAGSIIGIRKALDLKAGTLTATTPIIMVSNASGTAYLDNFSPGFTGNYLGEITMQRYVSTSGFHHMGAAVAVTDIAGQLSEAGLYGPDMGQVIPLPDCNPDFIDGASPYGNMFEWHEDSNFVYNCNQSGWFVRSSGSMQAGRGYTLNFPAGSTFDLTGTPHLSTVSYGPLGNTNAVGNGFHLVSNPYPSDVECVSIISGFDAAIYIYQSTGQYPGTYQSALPGMGTMIASQQAFFVRRTSGSGAYSVPLSWRRTGSATYFRETANNGLEIIVNGQGFADHTQINFAPWASPDFDGSSDAFKIDNGNNQPQLASTNGHENLSINTLNIDEVAEIPLVFKTGMQGDYTFAFNTEKQGLMLEDKYLKIFRPLTNPYSFTSTNNDENRFAIHARLSDSNSSENVPFTVFVNNRTLNITGGSDTDVAIDLVDLAGRVVWQSQAKLEIGSNQVLLPQASSGLYLVKVSGLGFSSTLKVVLD